MAAAARAGLPPPEDDPLEGEESEEEEMESDEEGGDDGSESASLADFCDPDAGSDEDPSFDATADRGPDGEAALWSRMARMSISAHKERKGSVAVAPKMGKEETDLLAMVDKLARDDQLEKLKVYECKAYLRMHKLRLSGKKEVLLNRIREHIEVKNLGEEKYPVSSFVLNCKGDACNGDVVMFEQNIYKRKKGAPRGVRGPLCGQRTNAGRIIKESYGTAKQQHTFTIEILWSTGYKQWPPLHPLLIKGRNLYNDKIMRQPWPDEHKRIRVLQEKHARGFLARKSRDVRIHEKEIEKMKRFKRVNKNKRRGQENMNRKPSQKVLPQQKIVSMDTVHQRSDEGRAPSLQHGEPGNTRQQQISKQNPANHLFHQRFAYHQQCNEVFLQEGATRTSMPEFIDHKVPSVQHGEPEKTRQPSRPTPAQQIFEHPQQHNNHRPTHAQQMVKHPQQHNNHRPTPSQQMFKHPQRHNNHHQHNEVLPQEGTTRTFSILGQVPSLQHGGSGNARQQQKSSKPTPTQQTKNPQPLKHQDHNEVLLEECAKRTYKVDSIVHQNDASQNTGYGKGPCTQRGGSGNTMQQQKSSKPIPRQPVKNLPVSAKHQHQNEVVPQQGAKRTYRVDFIDHRNNTYHSTEYDESAFQPRGIVIHANTHQDGSDGHQHAHADHRWVQPLRPRNQDFYSRNQGKDYHDRVQMTHEQYHPQQRYYHNQYGYRQMTEDQYKPQQIHHQSQHDGWRMNQNQDHPQQNHQNYQFDQQFPRMKPCHYYQRGQWCPYEENCKFSHGN